MNVTIKTNDEKKIVELSYTDLLTGLYADLMLDESMPDDVKTPASMQAACSKPSS